MQKDFSAASEKAIRAEALRISEEELSVLTNNPARQLHQYFGYTNAADIEKMAGTGVADGIHEFLRRSGIKYTDLVELIKTRFINPYQSLLDFLEDLFGSSSMTASTIYNKLLQIRAGHA